MGVVPLHRTLEQELLALERGASMECLVCGEFVLRRPGGLLCPECGSALTLARGGEAAQLHLDIQAG